MKAVDTNILVYSEITTLPFHAAARSLVVDLAEGALPWAIPWPCLYEFLRVVTHARVFHPPVPMAVALDDLAQILASPALVLLHETDRHAAVMRRVLDRSGVTGNLVHDAHIATLCLEHGVSELLSGDGDFARFAGLKVTNPFTAA